jgi:hypothetical protein
VASLLLKPWRMTKLLCRSLIVTALSIAMASPAIADQTPVIPPAPSPAPPPAPTAYANLDLPSWLKLGVEHRGRLEGVTGSGFAADREDLYWLNRFRATARMSPRSWLTAAIQVQDARVEGRNGATAGAPFRDQLDLRLAYADVGAFEKSPLAVRAGRQELVFGDQRLVGHANWLNTARSFDGTRVVFRQKKLRIDGFAASVVTPQIGKFNESGGGNYFSGIDAQLLVLPFAGVVEPYEFVRNAPNLTSSTTGVRLAGKASKTLDYNTEIAAQRGSNGSDSISAWAGHWLAGRTFQMGSKSARLFGEYNYASGDRTPTDTTRGTFDQLFPTAHDKYGLADQVGWKNIHHARTGAEYRPLSKLLVAGSYHSFWLAERTDALYSAGGAVIARIAAGAPSRHVGQELDLQATYTPSPRVQIAGGYAHLFTGAFLRAATPGKAYNFPYVMVTTMLLGMEK